VTEMAMLIKAQ